MNLKYLHYSAANRSENRRKKCEERTNMKKKQWNQTFSIENWVNVIQLNRNFFFRYYFIYKFIAIPFNGITKFNRHYNGYPMDTVYVFECACLCIHLKFANFPIEYTLHFLMIISGLTTKVSFNLALPLSASTSASASASAGVALCGFLLFVCATGAWLSAIRECNYVSWLLTYHTHIYLQQGISISLKKNL